ncbi:MAG TPA: NUDIX domain-containing protein [Patescibacteria group bacterium]|nr:NUDIX domain-containing protein [Patescibacteria group bacterium]
MVRKKSVGVVIFKREGKAIRYLLLHHGGEYWNFPKGTQEKDETDAQTALRELEEETGIVNPKIIEGFCEKYEYDFDTHIKGGVKEKIYKTAIFYLGEVDQVKVKISHEHFDFGWFDYQTALKRLFYQRGQNLLKKAHQFLLKEQGIVL